VHILADGAAVVGAVPRACGQVIDIQTVHVKGYHHNPTTPQPTNASVREQTKPKPKPKHSENDKKTNEYEIERGFGLHLSCIRHNHTK
jgi:hypothetical protein